MALLLPRVSRRTLLHAGAAGLAAAGVELPVGAESVSRRNLIFILCAGGPSQLETWDPKPDAPMEVRGPYGAIRTSVDGVRFSETLPHLARCARDFAVVRSLHSDEPAVHEIGLQQIQTGAAFREREMPHFGSVLAARDGGAAPFVVLPRPQSPVGMELPVGQHAGALGSRFDPVVALSGDAGPAPWEYRAKPRRERRLALSGEGLHLGIDPAAPVLPREAFDLNRESDRNREAYGRTEIGESCLTARRLVEAGTRCVVVNHFPQLFDVHSWDCHGRRGLPTRVGDLKERVALPFDRALSALIRDLKDRGLYESTLVCCFGEFGRTPEINAEGGRDHWNRCWSVMLGGAGIRGGQVIGRSDLRGAEPAERPVTPAELAATVYAALGIPGSTRLHLADGSRASLVERGVQPIRELLAEG